MDPPMEMTIMAFMHINKRDVKDTLRQKGQWVHKTLEYRMWDAGRSTRGRCPDGTASTSGPRGFSFKLPASSETGRN